jgi:hypothetical protein
MEVAGVSAEHMLTCLQVTNSTLHCHILAEAVLGIGNIGFCLGPRTNIVSCDTGFTLYKLM